MIHGMGGGGQSILVGDIFILDFCLFIGEGAWRFFGGSYQRKMEGGGGGRAFW